jgi:hypothetical protein
MTLLSPCDLKSEHYLEGKTKQAEGSFPPTIEEPRE